MEHRRLAPLPAALVAVAVLLEAVAVPLSWRLEPVWDTLGYGAFSLAMVAAGALIVSRESHHRIGWLLVVAGYLNALTSDLPQGWGLRAAGHGWPAGPFGEWLNAWSWAPGFVWLVLLLVLFPTGRLPSRRWWVVVGTVVVGTMLTAVAWSLSAQTGADFVDGTNPYATDAVPTGVLLAVGLPLFLGSLVAAAASLLVRFRTAKGIERQQLKWLTFVAAADAVVLPAVVALWWVTPLVRPLAAVCLLAVPVATGMAVLRYRLYDIDVVINRSVVYGTLTVLLGGAYASVVLTLGSALGRRSSWVTAGATLLVAVAFGPLRARVQRAVDRRFDRTRFEALRRMDRFLDDLRAGNVAPEEVEGVLRSVLDDPALTLQFVLPESREWVDARGRPTTDRPDDERVRVRIDRAGATIATVRTERDRSNDRALLLDVVEAGVLAVEIARLRVELRRQLDEVRASRARIVAAGDRERRRIERDLHDGAQQRLVSIGLALRHAQHAMGPHAADACRTLEAAVDQITATIEELRELARGLRPADLDAGLGAALRELARRAPLRVDVRANGERFPEHVEMAAYFIACEGLTNAIKHAQASTIVLRVARTATGLAVSITDDGVGGATPNSGSGLTGLADRVHAHGGTLTIDSDRARGTRLEAELPCEL